LLTTGTGENLLLFLYWLYVDADPLAPVLDEMLLEEPGPHMLSPPDIEPPDIEPPDIEPPDIVEPAVLLE
jgi:hypothetical protein